MSSDACCRQYVIGIRGGIDALSQNIYDDPDFFTGYAQLLRPFGRLSKAPELPAIPSMLPCLRGSRVPDLGCGSGWFCRWAREQGTVSVPGIDLSEKMLSQAMAMTDDAVIRHQSTDLETPTLPDTGFDLINSPLALHGVVRLPDLIRATQRTLAPGESLVFSIEHPILVASRHARWGPHEDGSRCWSGDSYRQEGPRITGWIRAGVVKQHRTLGTLLNMLIDAGFMLTRIAEWSPMEAQIRNCPALGEETERPAFLLISAQRPTCEND